MAGRCRARSSRRAGFATDDVPFRLITNTTTHTRPGSPRRCATPASTSSPTRSSPPWSRRRVYLRSHHAGAQVFVLSDGDAREDLERSRARRRRRRRRRRARRGVRRLHLRRDQPGLPSAERRRRARRRCTGTSTGARARGSQLDGGAYVAALEEATGRRRRSICGKPSPAYFDAALEMLGVARRADGDGRRRRRERRARRAGRRAHRRARADREVPARPTSSVAHAGSTWSTRSPTCRRCSGSVADVGSDRTARARAVHRHRARSTRGRARSCRSARTLGGAGSWSRRWTRSPARSCSTSPPAPGLVSRDLAREANVRVVSLDPSEPMLRAGDPRERGRRARRPDPPGARAGRGASVRRRDLRRGHVHLPAALRRRPRRDAPPSSRASCAREARSRRSSSTCPQQPMLRAGWYAYTRGVLPVLGSFVSPQWRRTGRFLGPSITGSSDAHRCPSRCGGGRRPGIRHVRTRELTLGAAVVIWGVKEGRRGR